MDSSDDDRQQKFKGFSNELINTTFLNSFADADTKIKPGHVPVLAKLCRLFVEDGILRANEVALKRAGSEDADDMLDLEDIDDPELLELLQRDQDPQKRKTREADRVITAADLQHSLVQLMNDFR
jgi:hypothetical protein